MGIEKGVSGSIPCLTGPVAIHWMMSSVEGQRKRLLAVSDSELSFASKATPMIEALLWNTSDSLTVALEVSCDIS